MGLFLCADQSQNGVSRDSFHKRRPSGARRKAIRMNRKYELGRPPAMTKLAPRRVHLVRTRGGNTKFRALRLDTGNFSWGTQGVSRKTRLLTVKYNASNNELVRTNTLVKRGIVQIDGAPYRQWYKQHYGIDIGKKKAKEGTVVEEEEVKQKLHTKRIADTG